MKNGKLKVNKCSKHPRTSGKKTAQATSKTTRTPGPNWSWTKCPTGRGANVKGI